MTEQPSISTPDEIEPDDAPTGEDIEVIEGDLPLDNPAEDAEGGEWPEGESPYDDEMMQADTQDGEVGDHPTRAVGLISPSVRTGREATRWALGITQWHPSGMCQQFTRSTFGVGSYFGSAAAAWAGADYKHPTTNPYDIPAGVPVFWVGGSRGYGHAAVSLGHGLVRSTDWPSAYRVGTARIADIWSNLRLVGWTEDINNVRVWEDKPDAVVIAGLVTQAARKGEAIKAGKLLKRAVKAEVGQGDMNMSTPNLAGGFREQYALVQRKYLRALGADRVTKADADGIPGLSSLTWLGDRRGFGVVPTVAIFARRRRR